MFVDNLGRRSKPLRRLGLFVGVACIAYAAVLAPAFMGWSTSLPHPSCCP